MINGFPPICELCSSTPHKALMIHLIFQSTPSVWRETAKLYNVGINIFLSKYNSDKIGLFIYPHKPKKEPFDHNFLH